MSLSFFQTCKFGLTTFLVLTVVAFSAPFSLVQAGGGVAGGGATLGMQITQQAELAVSSVQNTLSAVGITSLATKEVLDGIAWQIAKQMVSSMTKSLVNWINSGFQGSPAFITDLNSFLLDALDTAAGEYIKSLGGIGEFICSPFQLDVQAALTINYAQARSGMPSGPTGPACKLSDIRNNVEGFLNGIGDQGWEDWLTITSNPQNTPYGAYLAAEAKLNIRLTNEAGQELEIANWGNGFLSKRVCEAIEGAPASQGTNCKITTPGQVISEALTFQLSTGPRTLIEADEVNEIIGALINQLALQAMQGINGLLGLGGNSNYTDDSFAGGSYLDAALAEETNVDTSALKNQMDNALINEQSYLSLINSSVDRASSTLASRGLSPTGTPQATTSPTNVSTDAGSSNELVALIAEATTAKITVEQNIVSLATLISTYVNATTTTSAPVDSRTGTTTTANSIRNKAIIDYVNLVGTGRLTSASIVATKRVAWGRLIP